MWKVSEYAYFLDFQDSYIVFNYLTSRIIRVYDTNAISRILNGSWADLENQHLLRQLINERIVVDDDVDERSCGKMLYYDTLFQNELFFTILSSEECNFRCKYCYENFKHRNISKDVIDQFTIYCRNNFKKYKRINIDWFGGEPLLGMDGIAALSQNMIEICRHYGIPYTASITTNGYLLTPEVFRELLKHKVYNFHITIDGLSNVHDSNRVLKNGNGTFERIISNLKSIRDTVKTSVCNIVIRTNVTRPLLDSIDTYLEFMENEFGEDKRFMFYFRPVGDWGGERVKSMSDRMVSSIDELYAPILASTHTLNYDAYADLLFKQTCSASYRNSFILGADGTIYKCSMLFDEEYNKVGELLHDGTIEIDYSKLSKWIVGDVPKGNNCKLCKLFPICNNHKCPAKYFWGNDGSKDNCGNDYKAIDYVLKLLVKSNSKYILNIV